MRPVARPSWSGSWEGAESGEYQSYALWFRFRLEIVAGLASGVLAESLNHNVCRSPPCETLLELPVFLGHQIAASVRYEVPASPPVHARESAELSQPRLKDPPVDSSGFTGE